MALEQVLRQEVKQLKSALKNGVKRSKISLAGNDDKKYQLSQVKYFADKVKNTHIITPYGLASNPSENEELLTFNVMGQEENTAGIPYAVKSRFKGLQKGEVRVGNPLSSASVLFRNDGVASINGSEFEGIPKIVELTTKLNALVTDYNLHTHSGVQTGAGISGVPTATTNTFSKSDYENTNVVHGQQGTGTSGGAGGAGGTVEWGNITGTLSNQTDLQSALDSKLSAETDPIFSASPAFGISAGDITNWNTAYSWGDHSVEGYLKNIVEDTTPQLGGDLDTNSNDIKFLDNDKAIFGTGLDFEIYSDGNDAILRQLTQDREIKFYTNDGGVDTLKATINGGTIALEVFGIIQANQGVIKFTQDGAAAVATGEVFSNTITHTPALRFIRGLGTKASPLAIISGTRIGSFQAVGYYDSSNSSRQAELLFTASENWSATNRGTKIEFQTTLNGSTTKTTQLEITGNANFDFKENPLINVGDITHDDATASDWVFRNSDLDKFTRFFGNYGGVDTELLTLDFLNKRIGIGTATPQARLDIEDATVANAFWTRTGGAQYILAAGLNFGFFGTKSNHENRVLVNDIPRLILDGDNLCFGTNLAGGVGSCLTNATLKFRIDGANNLVKIPYDNIKLTLGSGDDAEIFVDSSDDLNIKNVTQDKDIIFQTNDGGITRTNLQIFGDSNLVKLNRFLQIEADGASANVALNPYGSFGNLFTRRRNGTIASPTAVLNNDVLMRFGGGGYTGVGLTGNTAQVDMQATENWSASATGTQLSFDITPNGSTTRLSSLVMEQNGNVTFPFTAGCADCAVAKFEEKDTTPSNPTANVEVKTYMKDDKFIWQFNNAGTTRYFYIDLTQTAAQQVQHTTTAP